MADLHDKAWTCINRWERRGYAGQVETFKTVMAENERLRKALEGYACLCGGMSPDGVQSCWKQDKCGKEARNALGGK